MLVRICLESRRRQGASHTLVACAIALVPILLALALGRGSAHAQASCTISWDGGGDAASWNDANNWNTNTLPGATDDVCIIVAGSVTVTHASGDTTIDSLYSDHAVTLSGGVLSVAAPSEIRGLFTISGGILTGGGAIEAGSQVSWTGGRLEGTGTLNIPPGGQLRMEGPASKALLSRTINNHGTITWSGGGMASGYGAVLNNLAGATFDIASDGTWGNLGGIGGLTINNSGTLVKSAGTGMAHLTPAVNNSGVLEVGSGGLRLHAGGTSSGSFSGVAGTRLEFGAGTHNLEPSASVTSAGTVRFDALNGGSVNLAGMYNVSGSTEATAGNTNLTGTITALGSSLLVGGGIINLSSGDAIEVASVTLAGGSLTGADTVTAPSVSWSGGRLEGTGVLNIADGGQLRMEGPASKALMSSTINNHGTITWSGGGMASGFGAVLNNLAGATFDIASDGTWGNLGGTGGSTINNSGTLVKSAGPGTTALTTVLNNSGVLEVRTGTLWLVQQFPSFSASTATLNDGTYLITGTFRFPSANIVTNAASIVLNGPASKIVDGSNVDGLRNFAANAVDGTFTLRSGRALTTPAAFDNAGDVSVTSGSSFHVGGNYTQSAGTTRLEQGTLGANASVDIQAGLLSGVGTVVGNVSNAVQLIPGASPGILAVNGDYSQTPRGALRIEIGGLTAGDEFDRLTVSGRAGLDGTLGLVLIDGFSPASSDSFQILSAGSVSGSFAELDGTAIDAERAFVANYRTADVTLTIVETTPNRQPTVDAGGPYMVDEGGTITLSATGSDPDGDPLTFAWDLDGNGTFESDGSSVPFSAAALDGPTARAIAVQVSDGGSLTASDHALVDVINVDPTAELSNDGPVREGDAAAIRFDRPRDPSNADTGAGLRFAFACDGGSLAGSIYAGASADPATSCTGLDNPGQTIRARIIDKDGGFTEYETTLTIANMAPTVGEISVPMQPAQVLTSISTGATFVDTGVMDTHTAVWDWGDGTVSPAGITESDGAGSVTGTHTYSTAGVYTVILTVTDKDNAAGQSSFQYVVVYDPSAGYVTGRGSIDSPLGAYTPDPSLTGEATFGFVSRYQKGATAPSGHTHFRFRIADLIFRSTDYQWLVVSGAKAQYKGSGTINGSSAAYGFLLSAIDGGVNGSGVDTFRIKIWDQATGTIIYDNQRDSGDDAAPSTSITDGNIIIHQGK